MKISLVKNKSTGNGAERRVHRRHDMEIQGIPVGRWDGSRDAKSLGNIVDLSASGLRIRTKEASVKPDQQIRVHLELPSYAGISPFITSSTSELEPKNEWTGWMTVSRVVPVTQNEYDVAGRLLDMDDISRGMLGLYLSTQPIAA